MMELHIERLADDITRAIPVGRWDVAGAAVIDLRLSVIAGTGRPVIIDMAQVSYLSSMGIRSLVMSAKATKIRGGKLVLLAPSTPVEEVLVVAGIDQIIAIYHELEQATLAVLA